MDFKMNLFILIVFSMFGMGYLCNSKPSPPPDIPSFCGFPVDAHRCSPGLVLPHWKRYWYSREKKDCVPFSLVGCAGNDKKHFRTYEECLTRCNTTHLKNNTIYLRYLLKTVFETILNSIIENIKNITLLKV